MSGLESSSLVNLYLARLREFVRQPSRIFWVYGFPLILAIGLGLAFPSRQISEVHVDLVRNEQTDAIVGLLEAQSETQPIQVQWVVRDEEEARRRLMTGKVPVVVVPLSPDEVEYLYDPTRPEALNVKSLVDDRLQRAAGRTDPVSSQETLITEPGARYIDFLIPGLLGLNIMGGGLWGVGFLIVNFRIGKLLKRFVATPMPRQNFLLAILGARLTFLIPDLTILLGGVGVLVFGMPIRGSLALVILVALVGAMAFSGIGLLVASRAKTTETVSGLMNLVMMPMWLLSGVFFSYDNFPEVVHPLIQALPLTQLLDALRAIMLEGAGLLEVGSNLLILASYAVVSFLVALRLFRWS